LEEHGVLIRKVYAQIPPKVEYRLTALGKKLKPMIDSMIEWGTEYTSKMGGISKKWFGTEENNKVEPKNKDNEDEKSC
jgi:DNA-binding HxlR family transcriptional regulator